MVIAIRGSRFQQQVRSFAEERRMRQVGSLRERPKSGNSNGKAPRGRLRVFFYHGEKEIGGRTSACWCCWKGGGGSSLFTAKRVSCAGEEPFYIIVTE
ncbi:hypothetical protein R1flu_004117 [Riccia fluitans]|uniref:Uncharacterized protein n=1 Tax=Riccia fluitans TaxID=41844 RepID=A0ABD1YPN0_9MARC